MQKLITAHDTHHYERKLDHALASLDEEDLVSKKNKEAIYLTSSMEIRRD
jgi:uroporphyrinogen-III synthase